tara:strand:- start:494 stop:673 length:180 start_codon:yes stop_codon:yes gene_type:complete
MVGGRIASDVARLHRYYAVLHCVVVCCSHQHCGNVAARRGAVAFDILDRANVALAIVMG